MDEGRFIMHQAGFQKQQPELRAIKDLSTWSLEWMLGARCQDHSQTVFLASLSLAQPQIPTMYSSAHHSINNTAHSHIPSQSILPLGSSVPGSHPAKSLPTLNNQYKSQLRTSPHGPRAPHAGPPTLSLPGVEMTPMASTKASYLAPLSASSCYLATTVVHCPSC